jgi:hypothetical protein
MTMVTKIGITVALVAFLAVPSASFAAHKTKNSHRYDVTKCEAGGCTGVNPDRDFINTSRDAQYYRSSHRKHKNQPKS